VKRSRREGRWADIPSPRLRFVFEAAFLILVAVGATLMELSPLAIVLLLGAAAILVALIEGASSRARALGAGEEHDVPPPAPAPEPSEEPAAPDGSAPPGPVVTKRPLDLPDLEQPPAAAPAATVRPRRALARAARRVIPPAPSPPSAPPAPPPAREWNLWDLERRAREQAVDAPRAEEWSALFTNLRVFASPDGVLPKEFDKLVRESFPELIEAA
jgi:hypothetical protein